MFVTPLSSAWVHRDLLARLVRRDVERRFRGSLLGRVWAFLIPLIVLSLYTFTFSTIIQPRWQNTAKNGAEIALTYFAGLIIFDFVFDCIGRAPSLMLEHLSYIKKVVFPVEVLGWVVVLSALVRLGISLFLLMLFYVFLSGLPPLSALVLPILFIPLSLFAVGFVWLLAALGVFVRDVKQVIMVAAPFVMFLSPVLFPLSAVPERFQKFFYANPMTFALEGARAALFQGEWVSWPAFALYCVASILFTWLSYLAFSSLRPGFADVL